ncbi:MAG: hypothetical protein MHM6MM_001627 [Cercozoa sp. M6MM]
MKNLEVVESHSVLLAQDDGCHDIRSIEQYVRDSPSGLIFAVVRADDEQLLMCVENDKTRFAVPLIQNELLLDEADTVVSMAFLSELDAVILVTSMGAIVQVSLGRDADGYAGGEMRPLGEVLGVIDDGIDHACWSPDQELLAIATGAAQVMLMTTDFDVVCESPIMNKSTNPNETPVHAFDAFKREQENAPESAAAEQDDESLENHEICWRGDSQFFAVSSEGNNGRRFRVFDRTGGSVSTSEHLWPRVQPSRHFAWRPDGSIIAAASTFLMDASLKHCTNTTVSSIDKRRLEKDEILEEQIEDCGNTEAVDESVAKRNVVVFYERNGLRRGALLFLRDEAADADKVLVTGVTWTGDSQFLCISLRRLVDGECVTQIWRRKNYHWYWQYTLPYASVVPDAEQHHRLLCAHTDNMLTQVHVRSRVESQHGSVVVIDGAQLKVSHLVKGAVPPPMCHAVLQVPRGSASGLHGVSHVALHPRGRAVVAVRDGVAHVFDLASGTVTATVPLGQSTVRHVRLIALPSDSPTDGDCDGFAITAITDGEDGFGDGSTDGEWLLIARSDGTVARVSVPRVDGVAVTRGGTVVVLHVRNDRFLTVDALGGTVAEAVPSAWLPCVRADTEKTLPRRLRKIEVISLRDQLLLCTLDHAGHLRLGYEVLASQCTDFALSRDFLVFLAMVGPQQVSFYLDLRTALDDVFGETAQASFRCVERGASLIGFLPPSARTPRHTLCERVVLQQPRGNLEIIRPKAMVLAELRRRLQQRQLAHAVWLCRANRVSGNLMLGPSTSDVACRWLRQWTRGDAAAALCRQLEGEDAALAQWLCTLSDTVSDGSDSLIDCTDDTDTVERESDDVADHSADHSADHTARYRRDPRAQFLDSIGFDERRVPQLQEETAVTSRRDAVLQQVAHALIDQYSAATVMPLQSLFTALLKQSRPDYRTALTLLQRMPESMLDPSEFEPLLARFRALQSAELRALAIAEYLQDSDRALECCRDLLARLASLPDSSTVQEQRKKIREKALKLTKQKKRFAFARRLFADLPEMMSAVIRAEAAFLRAAGGSAKRAALLLTEVGDYGKALQCAVEAKCVSLAMRLAFRADAVENSNNRVEGQVVPKLVHDTAWQLCLKQVDDRSLSDLLCRYVLPYRLALGVDTSEAVEMCAASLVRQSDFDTVDILACSLFRESEDDWTQQVLRAACAHAEQLVQSLEQAPEKIGKIMQRLRVLRARRLVDKDFGKSKAELLLEQHDVMEAEGGDEAASVASGFTWNSLSTASTAMSSLSSFVSAYSTQSKQDRKRNKKRRQYLERKKQAAAKKNKSRKGDRFEDAALLKELQQLWPTLPMRESAAALQRFLRQRGARALAEQVCSRMLTLVRHCARHEALPMLRDASSICLKPVEQQDLLPTLSGGGWHWPHSSLYPRQEEHLLRDPHDVRGQRRELRNALRNAEHAQQSGNPPPNDDADALADFL